MLIPLSLVKLLLFRKIVFNDILATEDNEWSSSSHRRYSTSSSISSKQRNSLGNHKSPSNRIKTDQSFKSALFVENIWKHSKCKIVNSSKRFFTKEFVDSKSKCHTLQVNTSKLGNFAEIYSKNARIFPESSTQNNSLPALTRNVGPSKLSTFASIYLLNPEANRFTGRQIVGVLTGINTVIGIADSVLIVLIIIVIVILAVALAGAIGYLGNQIIRYALAFLSKFLFLASILNT